MRAPLACALLCLLAGCASAPAARPQAPGWPAPAPPRGEALAPGARVVASAASLRLEGERLEGEVTLTLALAQETPALWLHAEGLDVREARLWVVGASGEEERALRIGAAGGRVFLQARAPLPAGALRVVLGFEAPLTGAFERVVEGGGRYAFYRGPLAALLPSGPPGEGALRLAIEAPEGQRALSGAALAPGAYEGPAGALALALGPFARVEAEPLPPSDARAQPLSLAAVGPRGTGPQLALALRELGALALRFEEALGPSGAQALTLAALPAQGALGAPGRVRLPLELLPRYHDAAAPARREALVAGLAAEWLGPARPGEEGLHAALARGLGAQVLGGASPGFAALARFVGEERLRAALFAYREGGEVALRAALGEASAGLAGLEAAPGRVALELACEGEAAVLRLRSEGPRLVCARYEGGEAPACALVDGEARLLLPRCPAWVHPDAGGLGAYTFELSPEAFAALGEARAQLTAPERRRLLDSAAAAAQAGALPLPALGALLAAEAGAEEPAVLAASLAPLAELVERVVSEARRPAARRMMRTRYARALRAVGVAARAGEDAERTARRRELLSFLALVGQDGPQRARLARQARDLVRGGALHPEALDPSLWSLALMVGAEQGDEALFDELEALLFASEAAGLRASLARALGAATAPPLRARALRLSLDPHLRPREAFVLLGAQAHAPGGREALLAFVEAEAEALLRRLGPALVPALVGGACSPEEAEALARALGPTLGELPGGAAALEAAQGAIRGCAARVARDRAAADALFGGAR